MRHSVAFELGQSGLTRPIYAPSNVSRETHLEGFKFPRRGNLGWRSQGFGA